MLTENSPASGFRLSPQQERLVKDFTESDMPRAVVRVRLDGPVDAARLEQALNRVVERHEILRTTFRRQTGMRLPLQVVSDQPQVAFASSASATSTDRSDPSAAPVVRAVLSSDATGATLELSLPPMCADSASLGALVEELAAAYTNSPLKADPVQYADYSEWQQQTLVATDEPAQDGRTFWTVARDTSTSVTIPFARPAAESEVFRPASIAVPVSAEINQQVAATAKSLGVPVSHLYLACWEVLLARVCGSSRVTSRLVLDGRTAPELVGALGPYAKSAPITVDIDDDSFADLVGRTSTAVRNAERWQDYVDATVDSATADFETIVPLPASTAAGWTIVDRASHLNRFTLKLTCEVAGAAIKSTLWYDADLVMRADTERLVAQFAALVASSCHDPRKAVGVLGLMAPGIAPARVLGSGVPQPAETMLDAFEAQAARTPLARAVSDAAGPLTYAELDARANQLAHWLREAQVARGSVVGLCGERSNALIVAVLATWKAGAAYLPLLPDQPSSRVSSQLDETAAAAVVVTEGARPPALEGYSGPVLCLSDGLGARSLSRLTDARSTPDDTAYVLYTSGSTGRPKGVVVRHRNLRAYSGALADSLASSAGVGGEGVQWATVSSLTADLGNTCIFPALITGGCVHMVPPSATLDGIALGAYMKANAIDVLKITPSHLAALLENSGDVLPRRVIIFGGEALTWALVAKVRARGTCAVWNHYGPTETTIGALVYPVPETAGTTRTVPIGRPLGQTELAVVDPAGAIVPVGVAGELRIGGPGVTAGYVNQPERTAERFVTPAWATGAPWYGTGDRVWMDASGVVEFIGRVDDQVKIRGYRVEPGEVEHALLKVPGVREGAVVAVGEISDRRLAAYIVADDGVNAEAVKSALRTTLPEYMVPASVVKMTALPRLSNGKIDRRQLAAQELESLATSGGVAPRNPTEAKLCEIWQTLLGRPTVGVFDNFFELGGHSLLATQVIAHVRRDFDVQLPLHVLFDSPTVAGLAEAVTDLLATVTSDPEIDQILASVENLSDSEVQWLLENERSDSDD